MFFASLCLARLDTSECNKDAVLASSPPCPPLRLSRPVRFQPPAGNRWISHRSQHCSLGGEETSLIGHSIARAASLKNSTIVCHTNFTPANIKGEGIGVPPLTLFP